MIEHVHTGWVRIIDGDRDYVPTDDWVIPEDALTCPCGGEFIGKLQTPAHLHTRCNSCQVAADFYRRTVFRLTK